MYGLANLPHFSVYTALLATSTMVEYQQILPHPHLGDFLLPYKLDFRAFGLAGCHLNLKTGCCGFEVARQRQLPQIRNPRSELRMPER